MVYVRFLSMFVLCMFLFTGEQVFSAQAVTSGSRITITSGNGHLYNVYITKITSIDHDTRTYPSAPPGSPISYGDTVSLAYGSNQIWSAQEFSGHYIQMNRGQILDWELFKITKDGAVPLINTVVNNGDTSVNFYSLKWGGYMASINQNYLLCNTSTIANDSFKFTISNLVQAAPLAAAVAAEQARLAEQARVAELARVAEQERLAAVAAEQARVAEQARAAAAAAPPIFVTSTVQRVPAPPLVVTSGSRMTLNINGRSYPNVMITKVDPLTRVIASSGSLIFYGDSVALNTCDSAGKPIASSYWCAEGNLPSYRIVSNRSNIGIWESYVIRKNGIVPPNTVVSSGDLDIGFYAAYWSSYVSLQGDGSLCANAPAVTTANEKFSMSAFVQEPRPPVTFYNYLGNPVQVGNGTSLTSATIPVPNNASIRVEGYTNLVVSFGGFRSTPPVKVTLPMTSITSDPNSLIPSDLSSGRAFHLDGGPSPSFKTGIAPGQGTIIATNLAS
jgi:hypothetical protein